jgi:hypothetical protein
MKTPNLFNDYISFFIIVIAAAITMLGCFNE